MFGIRWRIIKVPIIKKTNYYLLYSTLADCIIGTTTEDDYCKNHNESDEIGRAHV